MGSLAVMDSHSHWHCNVCSWNYPPSHFSSSKCHDGVLHGSDGSDGLAQPSNEATQSQQDLHTIYLLHEVAPKPHVFRLAWGALCPLPLLRSGMGPLLRVSRMPTVVCSGLLRSASPHQFSRATWQSIHFLSISASEYVVWVKSFFKEMRYSYHIKKFVFNFRHTLYFTTILIFPFQIINAYGQFKKCSC